MGKINILDEAIRHQVRLERLGTSLSEKFRKRTQKMVLITSKEISVIEDEIKDLEPDELAGLLREAQVKQSQIMLDTLADMTKDLKDLALYEAEYTGSQLGGVTRGVRIRSLKAKEAFSAALEQPIPATGALLKDFTEDWSTNEIKSVNELISKGYTQGWTNQQIQQALRGTKKLEYADGIMPRLGRNTDAVVRTAVQHVANTARMETWARNSDVVQGYKIIATLDGKTTNICRSLDQQVFKLGKGPRPPFHIRCRTTTVAEISEEFAFLNEGRTRSAEFGPVSAKQSYYDWLKSQDQEFQDETIGPARGKLLRDGGLTSDEFARLNLGRNFKPMTLDEMRKIEPKAFKQAGI